MKEYQMQENIMPAYLPAVAVQFTPKNGGEPVTVYRPFEALTLEELEKHLESDPNGASLELGERYFFGWGGVEKDYDKAYQYLRRAAELGVQDAMALLAAFYVQAETGMPHDPQKCVKLLTAAAENGSWRAMETLVSGYRDGTGGLPIDHEYAYQWAVQAERMLRIYWQFYSQPNFVDFQEKQKEILHAHTRMSVVLMFFCMNGVGVKRDLKEAEKWIDRGEKFVCEITGLASVPLFQEKRTVLKQRIQKDAARAEREEMEKKELEKKKGKQLRNH